MIKFEFDNKNKRISMRIEEDITALDFLNAIASIGYNVKQFAKDNFEKNKIEEFTKEALDFFVKGLKIDEEPEIKIKTEEPEEDIEKIAEKVLKKLKEMKAKGEL